MGPMGPIDASASGNVDGEVTLPLALGRSDFHGHVGDHHRSYAGYVSVNQHHGVFEFIDIVFRPR